MRLLNARTYEFHDVLGAIKPNYAILSHTWEDGEVLFEDIRDTTRAKWSARKGYFKIKKTCEQALQDGCDFVWIDTCNINKDSSTELSEAINSMFRWYRDAVICYAYISDISAGDRRSLSECRWLTRGWTLQEMIAPDRVHFYDMNWDYLGSRISLAAQLSESSGIHASVLLRRHRGQMGFQMPTEESHFVMKFTGEIEDTSYSRKTITESECQCCTSTEEDDVRSMLEGFSVAQKMKWASKRKTTREEDIAYCLMGLFDVNMPLLYGEGKKAFYRLQKAILGISSDHSILAFRSDPSEDLVAEQSPLLAPHPIFFRDEILNMHMPARGTHTTLAGTTLSVEMLICPLEGNGIARDEYLGILDCSIDGDPSMIPAILLSPVHRKKLIFRRSSGDVSLFRLGSEQLSEAVLITDHQLEPEELMWVPQKLAYNLSDIKRARITLVGEKTTNQDQRYAKAPIRVTISPIFHDLDFQTTSVPPLLAGHLPDATSSIGSIELSSPYAGRFCVDWWKASPGQLQCSISAGLQPGDCGVIQQRTLPTVDLEFESRDTCRTTPLETLCKSEFLLLAIWTTARLSARLSVWISVSRETFIGRSRFELEIEAKILNLWKNTEPSSQQSKMRNMLQERKPRIPPPMGMGDEARRLPHRQRDKTSLAKEER